MAQHSLTDRAWLLRSLTASETGSLTLRKGRLSFATHITVFDCPLAAVQAVHFPWFYFGAGCVLKVNGTRYRISFIQPGNTAGGEHSSIGEARRKSWRWKATLLGAGSVG
jgi:hypothetical protein